MRWARPVVSLLQEVDHTCSRYIPLEDRMGGCTFVPRDFVRYDEKVVVVRLPG